MFFPATHSHRPPQTDHDHLPPLPALILATDQDDHETTSSHQYELATNYCAYRSSGCESSSSTYSAILRPDQGIINGSGNGGLPRRSSSSQSLLIHTHNNHTSDFNCQSAVNVHRRVDLIDSCRDLQLQMQQQQQQQRHGFSWSKETSSSSIIEGMLNKASRYSPEEKKERIERYKTKRSHRNFNKTIKYACRKTLADSRPRIRGRFARNNNNDSSNNEDDNWSGNRYCEIADDYNCENNEDDKWLDLFNAAWLLE